MTIVNQHKIRNKDLYSIVIAFNTRDERIKGSEELEKNFGLKLIYKTGLTSSYNTDEKTLNKLKEVTERRKELYREAINYFG